MVGYIGSKAVTLSTTAADVAGDATIDGNLTVKGTTVTIDSAAVQEIKLGDNDKMTFGDATGGDLQIYHDGNHSYIKDVGTGNFELQTNGVIKLQKGATEYLAQFNVDGAVQLYYDNSQKLATTSTGIDVTGGVTTDGLTLSANSDIRATTGTWTGEHSGKIQYHNNEWYFQFADKMIGRNGSAVNVFTVDSSGDGYFAGGMALGSTVADRALLNVNHHNTVSNGIFNNAHIALTFDTAPQDNDSIAAITFATSDNDNYGFSIGAKRSSGGVGDFLFNNHYNSATGTELMRLSAGGSLIIDGNNTDGSHKLQIGEYNTNSASQAEGETKLIHVDDSYVMRVYRKHASGGLQSTGWYNVAKIPPFGTHGRVTVSLGGDFTADIVTIEWISSVDTALNNSVSQPKLTAKGTFANVTSPRITNTRIARDASTGGYFVQVYLSSGLNANTNGKSVLEVHMGEYVENNNSVNVAAMFNLFSGTTSHDWSCPITPNGTTKLGIHTKPEQPSFRVGKTAATSGIQVLVFDTEFHDIGNNYNTSNGRFTCPVDGIYYFGWQGISNISVTSNEQNVSLLVNGSAVNDTRFRGYTEQSGHIKSILNLSAGDYVEVKATNANTQIFGSSFHNQFMGYLLG